MGTPSELTPEARQILEQGLAACVVWVQQDHWVHTTSSAIAFQWFEYLLRSERRLRPRCVQVLGDAGAGKTALLKAFERHHPVATTDDPLRCTRPVLYADALLSGTGVPGLRSAIMKGAWGPDARIGGYESEANLDATLVQQQVRLILLDEAGELLKSGPSTHKHLLSELRRITHRLGINFVAATVSGLDHVFKQDPQLHSRFKKVIRLQAWQESEDFRSFLFAYERCLPFPERSFLDSEAILQWLVLKTEGNMEEIIVLLQDTALVALEDGCPCLTLELLKATHASDLPPRAGLKKVA